MIRGVGIVEVHEDGTQTTVAYEVPDDWEPPADWRRVGSMFAPDARALEKAAYSAGALAHLGDDT